MDWSGFAIVSWCVCTSPACVERPNPHLEHLTERDMQSAAFAQCLALMLQLRWRGSRQVICARCALLVPRRWTRCARACSTRGGAPEAQGRLDFTAEVECAGTGGPVDVTARIWTGLAHTVGRINFTGHSCINEPTLGRAMTNALRPAVVLQLLLLPRCYPGA